jgi:hypothetical protein
VGLVKQEFCILNVQYARQEYFEIVKDLAPRLKVATTP